MHLLRRHERSPFGLIPLQARLGHRFAAHAMHGHHQELTSQLQLDMGAFRPAARWHPETQARAVRPSRVGVIQQHEVAIGQHHPEERSRLTAAHKERGQRGPDADQRLTGNHVGADVMHVTMLGHE